MQVAMKGVVPQWCGTAPLSNASACVVPVPVRIFFAGRALGLFFLLCGISVKVADRLSVVLTFLPVFWKTQSSTPERQMKCQCFLAVVGIPPGHGVFPFFRKAVSLTGGLMWREGLKMVVSGSSPFRTACRSENVIV